MTALLPAICLLLVCAPRLSTRPVPTGTHDEESAEAYVRAVAVTPDGMLIAAGHGGGRVELIDTTDGEFLRNLEPKLTDHVRELAFSPDGRRLAGLSLDGRVRLWAIEGDSGEASRAIAGPLLALLPGDRYDRMWNYGALLLWSPDGQRLAVADQHGNNSLWTPDGELVQRWVVPDSPSGIPQLAWSPDGTRLYTHYQSLILVLDAESGETIEPPGDRWLFEGYRPLISMALSPDGELLATGHTKSVVRLWSLRTGRMLSETTYPNPVFEAPMEDSADSAFSPSGDRLAFSTREGAYVYVIDVASRRQIWRSGFLGGRSGVLMQLQWSPDGSRLWFTWAWGGTLYCVEPSGEAKPVSVGRSCVPDFGESLGVVAMPGGIGTVTPDGGAQLIAWRLPGLEAPVYPSALLTIALASSWMRFR